VYLGVSPLAGRDVRTASRACPDSSARPACQGECDFAGSGPVGALLPRVGGPSVGPAAPPATARPFHPYLSRDQIDLSRYSRLCGGMESQLAIPARVERTTESYEDFTYGRKSHWDFECPQKTLTIYS
jgi:hypothetical protein